MTDAGFNGLSGSPPSTGPTTNPVSVAQGGTGQTTLNAAINALLALGLGQSTIEALLDNITNTAPIARVLKHTSSGTTAAGFGIGDAVDLQSAAGNLRRVMTDILTLSTATDTAEVGLRTISTMVAGALSALALIGNDGNFSGGNFGGTGNGSAALPMLTVGPTSSKCGLYYSGGFFCFGNNGTQLMIASSAQLFAQVPLVVQSQFQEKQGTAIASASTLTLGSGNYFHITGTTTINYITTTGWAAGSRVDLYFDSTPTLTHNAASPPANTDPIRLVGSTNFTPAAGAKITLRLDSTLSQWVEIGRGGA